MILGHIQSAIAGYKTWLQKTAHHPFLYEWESLQNFQLHWDVESTDPAAMFDRAFQNSETRRLWQTEQWYPKRMMQIFWKEDPLTVRRMFDDLFDESRDLEARLGRFLFGCDILLGDYRRKYPTSVENNHYHGDFRMISLYLGFRWPEAYAPYQFETFRAALLRFGARDIPRENDFVRFAKVLRTLMGFLDKDPGVAQALQKQLRARRDFSGRTLLLAADFCRFAAKEA
ncbi:MAG: hypothetical protein IT259_02045 [Saprospiraceae bacterium]|nr:hypothetical protein [Saprospiraceae bacterium]